MGACLKTTKTQKSKKSHRIKLIYDLFFIMIYFHFRTKVSYLGFGNYSIKSKSKPEESTHNHKQDLAAPLDSLHPIMLA